MQILMFMNFHSLEVVDRVSETQLQVGENSNRLTDYNCHLFEAGESASYDSPRSNTELM